MSVRTSIENHTRVEITFSFDKEEEANAWLEQFNEAIALYKETKEEKPEQVHVPKNGKVPVKTRGKAMEKQTETEGG